ncbi:hypothetical protein LS633_00260 [Pseudomonas sp. NIBR-H-19]|uniref:hypothetical protein n=1 Tax=Pseudomonas sp. NIBR-H-19 TaxID=2901380 RepID=UPI001E3962F6|nr:hypothetical protein [Pseudomonas sp. NIBR-H-19]UHC82312.1 hypothetical protein LS633_00260 [Pseudomonas sp. NIBR-H-19]
MSAFYDRMAATALRLIERFGLAATLSEVTPGEYDPVTGVETGGATLTQTGQLILLDYTAQEAGIINAAGSLVRQGDKKIMLAAKGLEWPPSMTTTVLADGLTWTVVNVKSTNPAGTPLVYELHGRR